MQYYSHEFFAVNIDDILSEACTAVQLFGWHVIGSELRAHMAIPDVCTAKALYALYSIDIHVVNFQAILWRNLRKISIFGEIHAK